MVLLNAAHFRCFAVFCLNLFVNTKFCILPNFVCFILHFYHILICYWCQDYGWIFLEVLGIGIGQRSVVKYGG